MPAVTKTLEYRRARFNENNINLEMLTRAAWAMFPTHMERSVPGSNHATVTGLQGRDFGTLGFAIHGARYHAGQGVGIIPMVPSTTVELGERPPEDGENFLSSDFLALIKDNHLICLNCGRGGGALRAYLSNLIAKSGRPPVDQQFELNRVARPKHFEMLRKVGVAHVDMRINLKAATLDVLEENSGRPVGFWGAIRQQVGELVATMARKDSEIGNLRDAENGYVTVSIDLQKRDITRARHGMDRLASELVEDDEADDYVIRLKDSTKITPNEMSVQKLVKLEARANSVGVGQAWEAMCRYVKDLDEVGQLRV